MLVGLGQQGPNGPLRPLLGHAYFSWQVKGLLPLPFTAQGLTELSFRRKISLTSYPNLGISSLKTPRDSSS